MLGPVRVLAIVGLVFVATGCGHISNHHASEPASDGARQAVVIGPEDADHLWIFDRDNDRLGEFQIYVDPETHPEASASFARFALEAGGELPVHRHEKTEEIGYFLSGEGVVTIYEDDTASDVPVREGHVVYIPPGAWHTVKNTGQEPFALVFATIPNEKKGLLSFFRRIGAKPGEDAPTIPPEEIQRLAAEHDLIFRPETVD